jgi:hypothetical protein
MTWFSELSPDQMGILLVGVPVLLWMLYQGIVEDEIKPWYHARMREKQRQKLEPRLLCFG